jgi:hypothetical protein
VNASLTGAIVLALAAAAALAFVWGAYPLWAFGQPGPGLLPAMAAALVLIATLSAILAQRRTGEPVASPVDLAPETAAPASRKVFVYVAGLVALPPAIAVLGMLAALGLFVLLILRFVERADTGLACAVAGGSVAGSWLLFEVLLRVSLPQPFWW